MSSQIGDENKRKVSTCPLPPGKIGEKNIRKIREQPCAPVLLQSIIEELARRRQVDARH
jgi:hypothetical protein